MRSFNPYPDEHDLAKQTRERRKKPCNFDQKIPMKILSHYPLVLPSQKIHDPPTFCETFSHPKASLVNAQKKKKKTGKEKQNKQRGENAKDKRPGGSKTFSKKNTHARTSKAVICLQEQKLV